MCVKQHEANGRSGARRILLACGAVLLAFSISGCSAVNLTNFDFPKFGLLKNNGEDEDRNASSVSPYPEGNAEKLGMAQ